MQPIPKLAEWADCDKTKNSWHQNYIGVVSRLPIASSGHRPIETHYVH